MKQTFVLASLFVAGVTACGGATPPPATPVDANAAPAATPAATANKTPSNFSEQVALGQELYVAKCAGCHGNSGEGKGGAPAVVGLAQGALPLDPPRAAKFRKNQFKTVADIADFVVHNMPPTAPGSLKEEEYWSILAFDLKANGIDLGDKKLDGALASTLDVPRK